MLTSGASLASSAFSNYANFLFQYYMIKKCRLYVVLELHCTTQYMAKQATKTLESGFSERQDLGPIGSEQPVTGIGGGANGHSVFNGTEIFLKSCGDSTPPDLSAALSTGELFVGDTVSATALSDPNSTPHYVGSSGLVVPRRSSELSTASSDESVDLDTALQKNRAKKETINNLKRELVATKETLTHELEETKKNNETLEYKLRQKQREMESLEETHQVEIKELEKEVELKDEEVQKVKKQLAETEKTNNAEKMELIEHVRELEEKHDQLRLSNEQMKKLYEHQIAKLEADLSTAKADAKIKESELAELRAAVENVKVENRLKQLQLREEIVDLKEKIQVMKDHEHKLEMEAANTKIELECEKRRNSVCEVERLKKEHKEELSKIQEDSVSKDEHDTALETQRSNSIPKDEHEATVKAKDTEIEKLKDKLANTN